MRYHGSIQVLAFVYLLNVCAPSLELQAIERPYAQVALERAENIVKPLQLETEKHNRLCSVVSNYYQDIHSIHVTRDEAIAALNATTEIATAKQTIQDSAELKVLRMHLSFEAQLVAALTPEQVEHIKNGLTYNVVPITYKAYLELYPELKEEEKRYIMTQLLEAREFAMHAGSSDDKHHKFGKYKGRINNYLSQAGYNAKEAEAALKLRKQQAMVK